MQRRSDSPTPPSHSATRRILGVFGLRHSWDRSVIRGLVDIARSEGWDLMQAPPSDSIAETVYVWKPAVVVTEGLLRGTDSAGRIGGAPVIAANIDLTAHGIPSVCCNEAAIAELAADHFGKTGLKHVAAFSYSRTPFGVARIDAFRRAASALQMTYHAGGEFSADHASPDFCSHEAIIAWLQRLPKPCGVFACCDHWARPVAHYCRHLDYRIPDDIALIGADNDALVCELSSPPLSSIAVPWQQMGQTIAGMIRTMLRGAAVRPERIDVAPVGVVARRSSDLLSIDDPEVIAAVRWIRANAHRMLSVSDVARAVPAYRQRLERLFKAHLGRTIMQEVRLAHLAIAKELLASTDLPMPEIARRSGFSNATILGIAFQKELAMTPSAYRRRFDRSTDETT